MGRARGTLRLCLNVLSEATGYKSLEGSGLWRRSRRGALSSGNKGGGEREQGKQGSKGGLDYSSHHAQLEVKVVEKPDSAASHLAKLLLSGASPPLPTWRGTLSAHGPPQQTPETGAGAVPKLPPGRQGQAGVPASDPSRVPEERPDPPGERHAHRIPGPPGAEAAGAAPKCSHQADGGLCQKARGPAVTLETPLERKQHSSRLVQG